MIFVTLGSQKFQFNRLLKEVDRLAKELGPTEKIFAQTGYSDYKPKHYDYKEFLDREEFSEAMDDAEIVITHGGTGAIIGAVKKGKKVIAVPRLVKFGEHVDNHQIQMIEQFNELDLIYYCEDLNLVDAIAIVKGKKFKEYISNTATIIRDIEEYINS